MDNKVKKGVPQADPKNSVGKKGEIIFCPDKFHGTITFILKETKYKRIRRGKQEKNDKGYHKGGNKKVRYQALSHIPFFHR
jgi:hypothetical protein